MRRTVLPCLALALTACERVVDVDLDEGPRRLVVEARLERILGNVNGQQSIRLSTTGPYFSNAAPPAARGAVVVVTDDQGRRYPFVESSTPGVYRTSDLIIERGRRYALAIDFQSERFEATERTVAVPPIDSLYFDKPRPGRFSGSEGVRATIDLVDLPDEQNFYLWDQYVDGVRLLGPDSSFKFRIIAPDDGFDGLPIKGFQPYEGVDIGVGSTVLVRQIALSEAMYRFYFAFSDQVSNDGSVFSVPPSSVRGNVANRSTPGRPALGYFYVAEVAEARAVRR